MFGISVLVFLIFFATPGSDPAARIAGRNASPETLAAVRKDFGLDRPLPVQWARDDAAAVRHPRPDLVRQSRAEGGAAGDARRSRSPCPWSWVRPCSGSRAGSRSGSLAAATRGSLVDRGLMILGLIGISMPVFWLGEVMNLLTQSRFHDTWLFSWVPALGYKPLLEDPVGWFKTW